MTPFDIVLVPFPFVDRISSKKRPCLILTSYRPRSLTNHVVLAMMTSQVEQPRFPFDILVEDFLEAGLPKPTLIRLGKIVTLDEGLIVKKIGRLPTSEQRNINLGLKRMFNL